MRFNSCFVKQHWICLAFAACIFKTTVVTALPAHDPPTRFTSGSKLLSKRAPYNRNIAQADSVSNLLTEDMRYEVPNSPNQVDLYGNYAEFRVDPDNESDFQFPENGVEAAMLSWIGRWEVGFTANWFDSTWWAWNAQGYQVTVRFDLSTGLDAIAMSLGQLGFYLFHIESYRRRRNITRGILQMRFQYVTIQVYGSRPPRDQRPPPMTDRIIPPPSGDRNGSGIYVPLLEQDYRPYYYYAVCGPPLGRVNGRSLDPVVRSERPKDIAGQGTSSGGGQSNNMRRSNETTWIDERTGWQAVQVSHAAGLLGYNLSKTYDFVSTTPKEHVSLWADRINQGLITSDAAKEEAIADLLFGSDKPSEDECQHARAVLSGEDEATGRLPAQGSGAHLAKRYCDDRITISTRHGISSEQRTKVLEEVILTSLHRLPGDFNSIEPIKGVFLSWGSETQFNGGRPPAYEEAVPYFYEFIKRCPFDAPHSAHFKDAVFGQVRQAVCISNRRKYCT